MDIFVNFPSLEQTINQIRQNMQVLMDNMQGIQQISSSFQGGGFVGESGDLFSQLLQRDANFVRQLRANFEKCGGLLGDTITEFTDTDTNIKNQIPSA